MNVQLKELPLNKKLYKTVDFKVKSFSNDDDYFYFEAYLSTFGNKDRGDDIVVKGAFLDSLEEHIPSLLGFHKSNEPPLGIFDEIYEDEVGLFVKGKMPLKDAFVKDRIIPQMEIGSIKSMSIGYSIKNRADVEYKDGARYIKKAFLWEGSLVVIPMNDQANIKSFVPFQSDMPIADRMTDWNELSAIGRIREWAGVEEDGLEDPENQKQYRSAFLWYDQEDPQFFGSYKLPIADIIDGKLTIVPRAVFAAAGKLNGAEGGVWFWFEQDRPSVMRTVEKYYEKIGLESPFGKQFRVDDLKAHDEKTLEKLFKHGATFSQKTSKTLVSFIKAGFKRDAKKLDNQCDVDITDDWSEVLKSIKTIKIHKEL